MAIWGKSDQIVQEAYGRANATSFPNGRFELVPYDGHLKHLKQPEHVLHAIYRFAGSNEPVRHHIVRQSASAMRAGRRPSSVASRIGST